MSALSNWYPIDPIAQWLVLVTIIVATVAFVALLMSLCFRLRPAVRHWILFSALLIALASPLLVAGFSAAGISFIKLSLYSSEKSDTGLFETAFEQRHESLTDAAKESVIPTTAPPYAITSPRS